MQGFDGPEGEGAVFLAAGAQLEQHRLAGRRGDEFLLARENKLDRPFGHFGEEYRDRLERIDIELGAEAAADRRLDDANSSGIDAELLGEFALVQKRNLRI